MRFFLVLLGKMNQSTLYLLIISEVSASPPSCAKRVSMLHTIKPKKKPTVVANKMPIISLKSPNRMSEWSLITMPNIVAIIGPYKVKIWQMNKKETIYCKFEIALVLTMSGEISILETKKIVLSSTKPTEANVLPR